MKTFSTPILIVLAIICLVAVRNWRSARSGLQAITSDLITTSNKLSETTAQLVTKAATIETFRITQNLHAADLATVSNRLAALTAELDRASQVTRQTGGMLRQRESELTLAKAEIGKLQQTTEQLRVDAGALQTQLATAETQIKVEHERGAALAAANNELQTDKAIFLQQWNDPASLRAQLTRADQAKAVNEGVMSAAKFTKLVLEPNGSVATVPVVFKDVPGSNAPMR